MQGFVAMVPAILQQPVGYVCADRGFAGVSPRGKVYKQCQKTIGGNIHEEACFNAAGADDGAGGCDECGCRL